MQTARIEKGLLDLQKNALETQVIALDGDWEFYWQGFIYTIDFDSISQKSYQKSPSKWRGTLWQGKELGRDGYASYRLRILLPPNKYKRLALRVPRVSTAYMLYVNDKFVGSNGQIGKTIETTKPQYYSKVYEFEVENSTIDVIFHVSNFHYHSGGLWDSIDLSSPENLRNRREQFLFLDFLLIGGILMIGLYHLGIYFQRKEDKSNLYFFVLCLTVIFRLISSGERLLTQFFPDFNWEIMIKMEFISAMIAFIYLSYFFRWLFPQDYPKWVIKIILVTELIFISIFAFLPARLGSYAIPYHNYASFGILLANLVVVALAVVRKRNGAVILAWGFAVGAIFVANDILHNMQIVDTSSTAPVGLLVFFFSQAVLLSSLSSKAFKKVLHLSDELEVTNVRLEEKVIMRTAQLQETNEELNQIVEELNTTIELSKNQKQEIELQNKNITSSINYAKRIQEAMLPIEEEIKAVFPQSFVLYKPKDIVSGDFYWFANKDDKQILIVADCTGHGIPGAFMSVLGLSIIHQLVSLYGVTSPEKILHDLNDGIRKVLRQETNKQHEGMDIAVCVIDKKKATLEYAGARRPLYYVQDNEVNEIKGDRISVGGGNDERIFNKHTISIHSPITLYLFSDGYQDQYSSHTGKKLGAKLFKEMLFEIHRESANLQLSTLEEKFELWRGTERQIDDVLVLGVKIS